MNRKGLRLTCKLQTDETPDRLCFTELFAEGMTAYLPHSHLWPDFLISVSLQTYISSLVSYKVLGKGRIRAEHATLRWDVHWWAWLRKLIPNICSVYAKSFPDRSLDHFQIAFWTSVSRYKVCCILCEESTNHNQPKWSRNSAKGWAVVAQSTEEWRGEAALFVVRLFYGTVLLRFPKKIPTLKQSTPGKAEAKKVSGKETRFTGTTYCAFTTVNVEQFLHLNKA